MLNAFLFSIVIGLLNLNKPDDKLLKVKSIVAAYHITPGYKLMYDDSIITLRGEKYEIRSMESFDKTGVPLSIRTWHSEGYLDEDKAYFTSTIKYWPERYLLKGRVNMPDSTHLYINDKPIKIVEHNTALKKIYYRSPGENLMLYCISYF